MYKRKKSFSAWWERELIIFMMATAILVNKSLEFFERYILNTLVLFTFVKKHNTVPISELNYDYFL